MSLSNVTLILFLVLLILPPLVFKLWIWFWALLAFAACLGLIEAVSKYLTDRTISQHFRKYLNEHKVKGYIILGCWVLAWFCLMAHLGWPK